LAARATSLRIGAQDSLRIGAQERLTMLVNKSFMTPLGSALSSAAIEKFHIGGASAYDLPFNPGPVQSGPRSIQLAAPAHFGVSSQENFLIESSFKMNYFSS
jgi:hypothetical protein